METYYDEFLREYPAPKKLSRENLAWAFYEWMLTNRKEQVKVDLKHYTPGDKEKP